MLCRDEQGQCESAVRLPHPIPNPSTPFSLRRKKIEDCLPAQDADGTALEIGRAPPRQGLKLERVVANPRGCNHTILEVEKMLLRLVVDSEVSAPALSVGTF